jgi:hypothetical protein
MIVKKENRIRHENSPKCTAYEYMMDDKDINIALAEIDGRYPDTGLVPLHGTQNNTNLLVSKCSLFLKAWIPLGRRPRRGC